MPSSPAIFHTSLKALVLLLFPAHARSRQNIYTSLWGKCTPKDT